jgi:hypothetical protein
VTVQGRLVDSPRLPGGTPIAALEPILTPLVVALGIAVLALLLLTLALWRRTSRLGRRLDAITRGAAGDSLEAILDAHLDKVFAVAREVDDLRGRAANLEATARRTFQRVGLVRYNPFEDTGGNQSFALALLDARGDGFVVSSLHARANTRVYAKAVQDGRAEGALSAEEAEAVRVALEAPSPARRAS